MRPLHMIDNAEEYRALAIARRNRGFATGKRAKGHSFKRPDPERGSWDELVLQAKGSFREACVQARAEYDWQSRLRFDVADVTDGDGFVSI
jgi:hypothetical protein